ncbi:hypothetical protein I3843_02G040600 [Carya illinoinensis]|uniref:DUF632 domain-containing protein n=1 Tax=Carya illinoinensis TaxID=32201 RepID=A0A922FP01_CARIL|nr:hypothetical protein I3842_02G050000 [Carya illinoinensis]KAG7990756.1 hypothetical protein I3843_02G040600 [Carya illinoinensis]
MEKFSLLIKKNITFDRSDMCLSFENISSVMEKLCMWEEKLYTKVKAQEIFHAVHEKKCSELKLLIAIGQDFTVRFVVLIYLTLLNALGDVLVNLYKPILAETLLYFFKIHLNKMIRNTTQNLLLEIDMSIKALESSTC